MSQEPEIRTVTTLQYKRDQIEAAIRNYERKLEQARADLVAVAAAIRVFENSGKTLEINGYADLHRLFRRRESTKMAFEALKQFGPLTTMQLARIIAARKGLDTRDAVLIKSIALRLVHALAVLCKQGRIADGGRVKNHRIWALPVQPDQSDHSNPGDRTAGGLNGTDVAPGV